VVSISDCFSNNKVPVNIIGSGFSILSCLIIIFEPEIISRPSPFVKLMQKDI